MRLFKMNAPFLKHNTILMPLVNRNSEWMSIRYWNKMTYRWRWCISSFHHSFNRKLRNRCHCEGVDMDYSIDCFWTHSQHPSISGFLHNTTEHFNPLLQSFCVFDSQKSSWIKNELNRLPVRILMSCFLVWHSPECINVWKVQKNVVS